MTVEDWLGHLNRAGKSAATITSYRRGLAHFAAWSKQTYGQDFDPAAIIPRDIADWKSFQQTVEKAAPATINTRLAAVSSFFRWGQAQGYIVTDPSANISSLRIPKRHPQALDEKSTRRLLRAVHKAGNLRDVAMVEILLGTGIRVSELLNLEMGDFTIHERSGWLVIRQSKNRQPRTIPISAPVRSALTAYLAQSPKPTRLKSENALLWTGERGPLTDPSGVVKMLKKYAYQAGLDTSISPHVLRHTFATRYLAANPDDLRGLAELMGHASLETVMIYTAPRPEELARRMEKVEQNYPVDFLKP